MKSREPFSVEFSRHSFKNAYERIRHAQSQDSTRPSTFGIFVQRKPGGTFLLATDGHRLARHAVEALPEGPPGLQIITPMFCERALACERTRFTLRWHDRDAESHFAALFGKEEWTRLTPLQYALPNVDAVIPDSSWGRSIRVSRKSLVAAIKTCDTPTLAIADGGLYVRDDSVLLPDKVAPERERRVGYEAIIAGEQGGTRFKAASATFNRQYLLDALKKPPKATALSASTDISKEVELRLSGDCDQVVISDVPVDEFGKPSDEATPFMAIVMPRRV